MPTPNEIERLADMASALRPDWPVRSLVTHLGTQHAKRSYRDLAVALAWICTDPATQTPARLAEHGPWWAATSVNSVKAGERQKCPEHNIPLTAGNCARCIDAASEHVPGRAARLWADIKHQQRQEDQP